MLKFSLPNQLEGSCNVKTNLFEYAHGKNQRISFIKHCENCKFCFSFQALQTTFKCLKCSLGLSKELMLSSTTESKSCKGHVTCGARATAASKIKRLGRMEGYARVESYKPTQQLYSQKPYLFQNKMMSSNKYAKASCTSLIRHCWMPNYRHSASTFTWSSACHKEETRIYKTWNRNRSGSQNFPEQSLRVLRKRLPH